MGKYRVTHTCGHSAEVELFGPYKGRDREVERLEGQVCTDCYKVQAREADAQLVEATKATVQLPELIGTPKQVAWAEAIRAKAYHAIQVRLACDPGNSDTLTARADAVLSNPSAKWWIDNRTSAHRL